MGSGSAGQRLDQQGIDASAARSAYRMAAVRAAIGSGIVMAPAPVLWSWGFSQEQRRSGAVKALLRVLGGRDAVLGLATMAARDDPTALRTMVSASEAIDTGDTVVSLALAVASPEARVPAVAWVLVGVPFSALGWRIRQRL